MHDWWEVRPESERPRWTVDPWVGVGPLRFGMTPDEVADALSGATAEKPSCVMTHRVTGEPPSATKCEFRDFGLRVFYDRAARLEGLTVDALRGPLVFAEGVGLTGRIPSEVEQWLVDRYETRFPGDEFELGYMGPGIPGSWSLGLVVNVQRLADRLVTRPVVFAEHVLDDAQHILPPEAWTIY
ncbi:hypothetical protein [Streptomyces xanthophaeus]|uniref:hypothetical protein n=1 Tax=Streptomyces xanthophaeus TaxID=67385 RepID=UPI00365E7BB6